MSCSACWIGRSECRASSSSITLRKSGERCCTTTNAIPGLGGKCEKKCSSDSRPPAEAPIPTTRNLSGLLSETIDVETDSELTTYATSFARVRRCITKQKKFHL